MIRGQVRKSGADAALEARISIDIAGENRVFQAVEVVVDTGFAGSLALPEPLIRALALQRGAERRSVTLANEQTIQTSVYAARLLWHGQPVDVWAPMMDNVPMIGTDLLAFCRLTIDWWDGGDVIIEERMPPAQ